MSQESLNAVLDYSQFRLSDQKAFNLLLEIARHASPTGKCGVVGNKRKCLGVVKMCQASGISRNWLENVLKRISEAGELTYEKHGEKGAAVHYVFQIDLPHSTVNSTQVQIDSVQLKGIAHNDNSTHDLEDTVQSLEVRIAQLEESLCAINALLEANSALIAQSLHTNCTVQLEVDESQNIEYRNNNSNSIDKSVVVDKPSHNETTTTAPPEKFFDLTAEEREIADYLIEQNWGPPSCYKTAQMEHVTLDWCKAFFKAFPREDVALVAHKIENNRSPPKKKRSVADFEVSVPEDLRDIIKH